MGQQPGNGGGAKLSDENLRAMLVSVTNPSSELCCIWQVPSGSGSNDGMEDRREGRSLVAMDDANPVLTLLR
jgi:hypothetical protein